MADIIRDVLGRFLPRSLDWHPVSSSNVHEAAYDGEAQELWVSLNGGTYIYEGVPNGVLDELLSADSAGGYLNTNIKPVYSFRKG